MSSEKTFLLSDSRTLDALLVSEKIFSLVSEDRLRILRELGKNPSYPAEIAKRLGMHSQTAYYHFRLLSQAGLVRSGALEEKSGGLAKKFFLTSEALAFPLKTEWKPFHHALGKPPSFLKPFLEGTHLNAKIVLGSPDSHGKYRARGSEFCVAELAMWLGGFGSFSYPLYLLDTELRERNRKENLFILGGPKVNVLAEEVNPFLKIRFSEKTFTLHSNISGRTYGENAGFLEIAENPFAKGKKFFVLAGSDHNATRIAVLALLKEPKRIEEGNLFDSSVCAKVVQGFDEDGDGIADTVEILE